MTYAEKKEKARNEAIEWSFWAGENPLSYEGLAIACNHFYKLGKRYGLLKEFRENGIC